ncbi:hypothetical protein [Uliginosibacterium gangwonense]|uniref:hypothetical protein n=1 Tax=Uliginosibacterium gangwonense TaxID=392736 RepID=UPI000477D7B5|nr:hypothetical protein [Uliginosibacterium gangwonense]
MSDDVALGLFLIALGLVLGLLSLYLYRRQRQRAPVVILGALFNPTAESPYQRLVDSTGGDEALAKRLIVEQLERSPNISYPEAVREAWIDFQFDYTRQQTQGAKDDSRAA